MTQLLSVFGSKPTFERAIPVGQRYLADPATLRRAFEGIFERKWFANHGPLVQQLDARLGEDWRGQATCVTNEGMAVMVGATALRFSGSVLAPALGPTHLTQGLRWAGLNVVLCDVDEDGWLDPAPPEDATACGWAISVPVGQSIPVALGERASAAQVPVLWDASRSYLSAQGYTPLRPNEEAVALSFNANQVLGGGEGGAVLCWSDARAHRARTARNFHLAQTFDRVEVRINGKMAEAPAALILAALDALPEFQAHNASLWKIASERAAGWGIFKLANPTGCQPTHRESLVISLDVEEARFGLDALQRVLQAEGISSQRFDGPVAHLASLSPSRWGPAAYPNAHRISQTHLELPFGAPVSIESMDRICSVLDLIQVNANRIASRLG
jgi:dTDP-4-amino-4,6-dideoxygalactose transaminase